VHGYACREGFEDALARELGRAGAPTVRRFPGFVGVEVTGDLVPDPAFGKHVLPDARVVEADSVGRLARGAFEAIAPSLDAASGPWVELAFADDDLVPRARLVMKELLSLLDEKLKRSFRRRGRSGDILQLGLVAEDAAVVSFATPKPLASGFLEPSLPHEIPQDKRAPSSAYRKAEEAYALLGVAPARNERVVDLGAAPGGWSWTALKRGAQVTAIDKAELLPPVAGAVTHLRKDAFSYEPETPFDWLLCDAITAPEKTLALLDRWIEKRWCSRLVVNIKFKGTADYGKIEEARSILTRHGMVRARIKQLEADKNEVTVLGVW
jgi:23S rRNA (cytidine2498-2'-O)-methyltransferase